MDRGIRKNLLYILLYLGIFITLVLPIIYSLSGALISGDFYALKQSKLTSLLGKSIAVSLFVSVFATILGTFLAYLVYKTTMAFANIFKIILLIPLLISPYILAVAWQDFFFLTLGQNSVMQSYLGVILVQIIIYTPLAMIIIGSGLSNIDASIEEAGQLIASKTSVLRHIILPLIKPALLSSLVLIFIFSISEFSVPAFFNVKVLTTEIFTQFSAFYNHSLAMLQSAILIFICLALLISERKHISDATFLSVGNKGFKSRKTDLKNKKSFFLGLIILWIFISILLPLFTLTYQSFYDGTNGFVKALALLTPTFLPSILLALSGAILITIIGFITAYYQLYLKHKYLNINYLLLFTFAIPSTVFGISLIHFYNSPYLHYIYSSYAILLIGYIGKFAFIGTKFIENSMRQIPQSFDESGKIMGISEFKRITRILIPLISPGIFGAFIIAFIFSLGELGVSIMLYPPGTALMPIKVFTIMANAPLSLTASMSLIVLLISLILIGLLYFGRKIFNRKLIINE